MKADDFLNKLISINIKDFYGVPDSLLKYFCYELEDRNDITNITTANEGSAISLAAGAYLGSGSPQCVYLQNSGIGNTMNPLISLMSKEVYDIPLLMIIGWRGQPDIKDEPQHQFQGEISKELLEIIGIKVIEFNKDISESEKERIFNEINISLINNDRIALLVKKGAITASVINKQTKVIENNKLNREEVVRYIAKNIEDDLIVSTTGKVSRELYEALNSIKGSHKQSFLTVGSMGHTSMIALGLALKQKESKVYCIDGDGAMIMHMGSISSIGNIRPNNLIHILINNSAHESVGGMKTSSECIDFCGVAKSVGFKNVFKVNTLDQLIEAFDISRKQNELMFIEIIVSNFSRENLVRPKETPIENKKIFMNFMEEKNEKSIH